MDKSHKILLWSIILFSIIKSIMSYFISTPSILSDEYIYIKLAQSIFFEGSYKLHGISSAIYPILYPLLISVTYIFKSAPTAYAIIKFLNAFTSSLIIIPSYLLLKEFVEDKKAVLFSIIIGFMPMNFSFSIFVMSENLFYTLFLFSIYFIYKSMIDEGLNFDVIAGIFIGLAFLTRTSGISLVIIVFFMFLYSLFVKDFKQVKKKFVMSIFALVVVSPWIVRNIIVFGFSLKDIIGQYSSEATAVVSSSFSFGSFLLWFLIYSAFLMLASGFIGVISLSSIKEKFKVHKYKILVILYFVSLFVILFGVANHAAHSPIKDYTIFSWLTGRPIGRYIDTILPFLMIVGFSFMNFKDNVSMKKSLWYGISLTFFGSLLFYFTLLPGNNISLSVFGALIFCLKLIGVNAIFISLIITIIVLSFILLLINYKRVLDYPNIILFLVLFFFISNVIGYSAAYYNSKANWENNEQVLLSSWINENVPYEKKIIIDENFCGLFNKSSNVLCTSEKSMSLVDLWIINPTVIGPINRTADYIVTRTVLSNELIKKTKSGIYLYKSI